MTVTDYSSGLFLPYFGKMEASDKSDISCKRAKRVKSFPVMSMEYHNIIPNLVRRAQLGWIMMNTSNELSLCRWHVITCFLLPKSGQYLQVSGWTTWAAYHRVVTLYQSKYWPLHCSRADWRMDHCCAGIWLCVVVAINVRVLYD